MHIQLPNEVRNALLRCVPYFTTFVYFVLDLLKDLTLLLLTRY